MVPRGSSEPELEGIEDIGVHKFERKYALGLFRKRTLLLLYAQGFVGVFPWNVITFWFFRYLEVERGFDESEILLTLGPAILMLAFGYFLGGVVGDFAFKRTPRGRLLVSMSAVLLGAVLLTITMNIPMAERTLFMGMMVLTALFIPFASANVVSTVHDITLPEIRSTALSIQLFIENVGAAIAPFIAGLIAVRYSLHDAILWICIIAWVFGSDNPGFCGLHGAGGYLQPARRNARASPKRARSSSTREDISVISVRALELRAA